MPTIIWKTAFRKFGLQFNETSGTFEKRSAEILNTFDEYLESTIAQIELAASKKLETWLIMQQCLDTFPEQKLVVKMISEAESEKIINALKSL